ncbi:hypothetical protein ILYODFUR_021334, partial [Ilyodon furcidens]
HVLLLLVLFAIPGVMMIVAYGLISREVYRGIQFETGLKKNSDVKNGRTSYLPSVPNDGDGCYINEVKRHNTVEMSAMSASTQSMKKDKNLNKASRTTMKDRSRVIRMLVVIVVSFFICWMPLYCVNTWRAFDNVTAERTLSGAPISFIHLLSYTSACVNPIIYCFMNRRFRLAMLRTFLICFLPCYHHYRRHRREERDNEEDVMATRGSMPRFSYTIVSVVKT